MKIAISEQKKLHNNMMRQYGVVVGDYMMLLKAEEITSLFDENLITYSDKDVATPQERLEAAQIHTKQVLIQKVFLLDRSLLIAAVFNIAVIASFVDVYIGYYWGVYLVVLNAIILWTAVLYAILGYIESRYVKLAMLHPLFQWFIPGDPP